MPETKSAGKVSGYASVFFDPKNPGSEIKLTGGVVERIRPGAFARALREKHDVHALINHNADLVVGRVKAGTLRLAEDRTGLKYEIDVADTNVGRDIVESVRRGDVSGASFSFAPVKIDFEDKGATIIRWVRDLDLFDISICTRGWYPAATSEARHRIGPVIPLDRRSTENKDALNWQHKMYLTRMRLALDNVP